MMLFSCDMDAFRMEFKKEGWEKIEANTETIGGWGVSLIDTYIDSIHRATRKPLPITVDTTVESYKKFFYPPLVRRTYLKRCGDTFDEYEFKGECPHWSWIDMHFIHAHITTADGLEFDEWYVITTQACFGDLNITPENIKKIPLTLETGRISDLGIKNTGAWVVDQTVF
jgi:hypothetical protein